MSGGLQSLRQHINRVLTRQTRPLYLVVDDDLRLVEWRGDGRYYGLESLQAGAPLDERLAPILPTDVQEAQAWRFVQLAGAPPCHVHIIRLDDGWGVAMLDASEEHAARLAQQQSAHELLLLRREREALIAELEQANRLKSNFIAGMSHEFRTPLTSIIGYSDQLGEIRPDDRETQHHLNAVGRGARYLLNLVENLLDQARIEIGPLQLHPGACELADISTEVEQLLRPVAGQKQLSLAWWFASDIPARLWLDAVRLKQVLINLVGNAVKFTEQGGVNVEFDWQDGRLQVAVADTGPGIDEADAAVIFEPFRQAAGRNQAKGAGLGLTISQALVQAMGGEIRLNTRKGEGSRFEFSIDAPAVRGAHVSGGGSLTGKKIVIADDDPDLLELFRLFLSSAGCEVATARDAASTLETVRRWRPDALLLDLNLGGDDGAAVAAELDTGEQHCKIIVLSATPNDAANEQQLSEVVDARWTKPISRTELLRGLAVLIADTG
ncbi:MAG: ATP-binding protein [Sedimenticolaceae bacterium]